MGSEACFEERHIKLRVHGITGLRVVELEAEVVRSGDGGRRVAEREAGWGRDGTFWRGRVGHGSRLRRAYRRGWKPLPFFQPAYETPRLKPRGA